MPDRSSHSYLFLSSSFIAEAPYTHTTAVPSHFLLLKFTETGCVEAAMPCIWRKTASSSHMQKSSLCSPGSGHTASAFAGFKGRMKCIFFSYLHTTIQTKLNPESHLPRKSWSQIHVSHMNYFFCF